jgi:hypothetical protein
MTLSSSSRAPGDSKLLTLNSALLTLIASALAP